MDEVMGINIGASSEMAERWKWGESVYYSFGGRRLLNNILIPYQPKGNKAKGDMVFEVFFLALGGFTSCIFVTSI